MGPSPLKRYVYGQRTLPEKRPFRPKKRQIFYPNSLKNYNFYLRTEPWVRHLLSVTSTDNALCPEKDHLDRKKTDIYPKSLKTYNFLPTNRPKGPSPLKRYVYGLRTLSEKDHLDRKKDKYLSKKPKKLQFSTYEPPQGSVTS
jgi:hypothetical protein